jgi:hypothetical protein
MPGGVTRSIPDFAEFTLGRTKGATRGLHPGWLLDPGALPASSHVSAASVLYRAIWYAGVMVKTLEQAIAEVQRLPAEDQEQIGRTLLSHVEKLRALRAEVDKGIRSLDAGQGRESSIADFIRQKNR